MRLLPLTTVLLLGLSVLAQEQLNSTSTVSNSARNTPADYLFGPDDQITVYVSEVEEINNKTARIDMRGELNLPLIGRIPASGITARQLEMEITTRLRKYVKVPDVIVSISEFRSQPVSILGAVSSPGVHQLQGHKNLFEMLSMAGGLRPDAGSTVKITRDLRWGRIPLPGTSDDSSGRFSVAAVSTKSIINSTNPSENIAVYPNDVISVSRAETIYAVGSVHKPGGFLLNENETLSALQILSLAEGLEKTAAPAKARILRAVPGQSARTEIAINLKQLMSGHGSDVPLRQNDILFVPDSAGKIAAKRAAEAAIQIGTGIAMYSRF